MSRAKYSRIEVIEVPREMADLAKRRTRGLLMASVAGPNALENMMMSCYIQGLSDGQDVALAAPREG